MNAPADSTAGPEPRAAYLHVPFCVHRCGYCDFTVVAGRDDLVPAWFEALETELALLETPRPVETLFLGGGTPTWLEPEDLARLLELATRWFPLLPQAEFSVEANPSGLDAGRMDVLARAGVNRISLGVQSFLDRDLELLERDHTAAQVEEVVGQLREVTDNLSCDLIFAVPGQSLADWQHNLSTALRLGFGHISTYGLTIEKGTAFWSRSRKGQLPAVPDELERAMYETAMDHLTAAGLEQYEISSFARPGLRCR
ncbi:MAG: radical SAM family heme chaperone HemW, partial [Planctomycetaceae bacterium]|nr:radical SAM family heme chaperone HemW [Planctomycetaceae bacterium]